jgi:hypothetical protein
MATPAGYIVSALALSLGMFSGVVSAKEFMPRLGITMEKHSNTTRTADTDNEISDTVQRPFFGFTFKEDTTDLKAKADVLFVHESYSKNTFDAQFLPTIDATLDWTIQPNRLSWVIEDYAYSQRIDVIAADTPDNQQTFNVFATGPDFVFARGLYDGLAKFRLADVYYSESEEDNQRLIATGVLTRAINEYSTGGVEASLSSVLFEEDYLVDYDIIGLVARYNREMPFGILDARLGLNYVNDENGASDSTPMVAMKVTSNKDSLHSWALTYSTRYTDPAMDAYDPFYSRLLDVSETREIQPGQIVGVGAYKTDRGEVSYGYNGSRLGITLSAFTGKNDYLLNSAENGNEKGGGVGLSYLISERMTLWADYYQSRTEYPNKGDKFAKTKSPSFGIAYAITESLSVVGGAYISDNDSDITDPKTGKLTQQYKDEVLYMTVEYKGQSKRN